MKYAKVFLLTILVLIFSFSSLIFADVPQMINYQGKITTPAGALIDTTVQMVFKIYDAATDGGVLWADTQSAVVVEKGVFSVLLGSGNPIPDSVFDGNVRYLGVKVGNDAEMTPRKEIVSVGYAFKSEFADTADYARAGVGGADNDWTFRITDTADTTLITGGEWGIARYGNTLYGNADSTHVNLGVACTTGTSGQNYKYCTVGGGESNTASKWYATVGGGYVNTASGHYATVGGGYRNTASGDYATVPGGYADTVAGDYSFATGHRVKLTSDADYTFAFGRNFTTSTPNAVIFHNSHDPIKVGIGTTAPDEELHVVGNIKMVDGNQAAGKVLTSDANGVGTWQSAAGGDNDWTFRITDTADTTLITGGAWGIARYGNVLYGNKDSTHVNLGVACTTGTSGQNYKYCTVGGGLGNTASGWHATVGGGYINTASDIWATVGGGGSNTASGHMGTVGGGYHNIASGRRATVGGGWGNTASDTAATIAGGRANVASGQYATVGGGYFDTASGNRATVGGGWYNTASGTRATVGGGENNTASNTHATVSGGWNNTASGQRATVGGGAHNIASGYYVTVAGGVGNAASGSNATVGGGDYNAASGVRATVTGGWNNTASGYCATIGGGWENTASGDYSFAAGYKVKLTVDADYTFAFGRDCTTSTPNAVIFSHPSSATRVGINKTNPAYAIDLPNNANVSGRGRANSWTTYSSARWKENVKPIENPLDKVLALRGVSFDWKESKKHDIGMIAEEVGEVVPEVVSYEEDGINAQALDYAKLTALLVEAIKEQQKKISALEQQIAELKR